jgi:murein DD-endopeptidase MepM/ murein hydrolase activator NlpD
MKLLSLLLLLAVPAWTADLDTTVDAMINADAILRMDLSVVPSIKPVDRPVSSGYGFRVDPFTRRIRMHQGEDIGCPVGTPVRASGGGVVVFAGRGRGYDGYGNVVVIRHTEKCSTLYAHLYVVGVYVGERVRRGDVIGLSGNSGRSKSPHVHMGVMMWNIFVDPSRYIGR